MMPRQTGANMTRIDTGYLDRLGVTYENDSAASMARAGGSRNPYRARPERESYEERAMKDGKVIARRDVYRWADNWSVGPWRAA